MTAAAARARASRPSMRAAPKRRTASARQRARRRCSGCAWWLGRAGLPCGNPVQRGTGRFRHHGTARGRSIVRFDGGGGGGGGGEVVAFQLGPALIDVPAAHSHPVDQPMGNASEFHHRPAPWRDGAGLGRQPQRLTDLGHHQFVEQRRPGDGVLKEHRGVGRSPRAVRATALDRHQQMNMQQRGARPRGVVPERSRDQASGRMRLVSPGLSPPHRRVAFDLVQDRFDRAVDSSLDQPPRHLIPQRPQHLHRPGRPEHQIHARALHRPAQRPRPPRHRGRVTGREPGGFECIGVGVPGLPEQPAKLRLRHYPAWHQTQGGKAPAGPAPRRHPRPHLRRPQAHSCRARGVAGHDMPQVVPVHLARTDQGDIHHRASPHQPSRGQAVCGGGVPHGGTAQAGASSASRHTGGSKPVGTQPPPARRGGQCHRSPVGRVPGACPVGAVNAASGRRRLGRHHQATGRPLGPQARSWAAPRRQCRTCPGPSPPTPRARRRQAPAMSTTRARIPTHVTAAAARIFRELMDSTPDATRRGAGSPYSYHPCCSLDQWRGMEHHTLATLLTPGLTELRMTSRSSGVPIYRRTACKMAAFTSNSPGSAPVANSTVNAADATPKWTAVVVVSPVPLRVTPDPASVGPWAGERPVRTGDPT